MRTLYFLSVLLAAALRVHDPSPAERTSCIQDVVCVTAERHEQGVVFVVDNRTAEPLGVVIDAGLEGLAADVPLPHTAIYPPGRSRAFAARAHGGGRWSYRYRFAYLPVHDTERTCHAPSFCVVREQALTSIRYYVENHGPAVLSARFEMQPTNMRMSTSFPYAGAFQPGRTLAFEGTVIDPLKPWDTSYRTRWAPGDVSQVPDLEYAYALPFAPGAAYTVVQGYHGRFSHQHTYALDFDLPRGTPVHAARDGVVVAVEERFGDGAPEERFRDRANYVHIQHADGTVGYYVHLERGGALVNVGDWVRRGQRIGLSGNSGYSAGPHLHFEVVRLTRDVRPASLPVRFRIGPRTTELREGEQYRAD
ncbi:MAG: M23 family metallopeptidase [Bacteroidetes bacterium]|nr:MAG: M23 family metallopeptidase [Bacteroidota bacterium]